MKNLGKTLLLSLVVLNFLFFSSNSVLASEETTPSAKPKIEYNLPYPGILPGHPLYKLKMVRDRILSLFISDPVKKAEYNLHMADKRLNAALFLLDKGKTKLAESTISKAEKYLEKSSNGMEQAYNAGRDITSLVSKLSLATLKHQEVLTEVLEKVPEEAKAGIQNALKKSEKGIERVSEVQARRLQERLQRREGEKEEATESAEERATPPGKIKK